MSVLLNETTNKALESFAAHPSHALLLIGPKSSGKTDVADFVASKLLNTEFDHSSSHPAVLNIDASISSVGIDSIRNIKKFLSLKTPGKDMIRRIVIIKNADNLNIESQNAALKFLEEPPADTCIILTAENLNNLKETIRSRTHRIRVNPLSKNQVNKILNNPPNIDEIYLYTDGLAGHVDALSQGTPNDNSYLKDAKNILTMPRYKRLIEADKLSKDKDYDISALLSAIYLILFTKLKMDLGKGVQNTSNKSTRVKLEQTFNAAKESRSTVQPKALLSSLFYKI